MRTVYVPVEERVVLEDSRSMNLMGLLIYDLFNRNLEDDLRYAVVRNIRGDIEIHGGRMIVTLRFGGGKVTLIAGSSLNTKAWVKGTLSAMLGLVTATDMIRPFLKGAVTFGGNPVLLTKILPLMFSGEVITDRLNALIQGLLRQGR